MAQPVTDDELQLRKRARRRLVGAIVLVLLVVVFLPMALDNEPKPLAPNVDIQVPSLDSAEKKFPAATPPPAAQPSAAPPAIAPSPAPQPEPAPALAAPKAEAPVVAPEVAMPVPTPERDKKPEATKKPVADKNPGLAKSPSPKATTPEPTKSAAQLEAQGYVVQLGAFSNAANANHLYQKLRAARFPAYLERVNTDGSTRTRVRAGPFPTEDAADKARQKLLQVGLAKGTLKISKQGE
jgi:DedD protein